MANILNGVEMSKFQSLSLGNYMFLSKKYIWLEKGSFF